LKINGIMLPEPSSLTVTPNKIWSKNTGRGDNGLMVGDIIAIKTTLKINWGILSASDIQKIDTLISEPFFTCTFLNPRKGNAEDTLAFYADAPTYPVYSYVKGYPEYKGIGIELIEQ